jgi:hypothetical protein
MNSTNESVYTDKRDLHIGGTGAGDFSAGQRGNSFNDAAAAESLIDRADRWVTRATAAARNADDYLRTSPWQAIGVVVLVGVAAGYLASRRFLASRS